MPSLNNVVVLSSSCLVASYPACPQQAVSAWQLRNALLSTLFKGVLKTVMAPRVAALSPLGNTALEGDLTLAMSAELEDR